MSDKLLAIVQVGCSRCARKHGRGTRLGELGKWPDGRWAWHPMLRKTIGRGSSSERVVEIRGLPKYTGGVELQCRRCKYTPRLRLQSLYNRAEVALASAAVDEDGVARVSEVLLI